MPVSGVKCNRDVRYDPDEVWSITDTDKGARATKETLELSQRPCSKKQFNVSNSRFPAICQKPGFELYIGQTSKELKCRSLTGPKKLCVFHNIHIRLLLPNFPCNEAGKIQHLWDELLQLNMLFCKPGKELSPDAIEGFERRARQWGRYFIGVYQTKNVTPYIHAFMNHVGQFMVYTCFYATRTRKTE